MSLESINPSQAQLLALAQAQQNGQQARPYAGQVNFAGGQDTYAGSSKKESGTSGWTWLFGGLAAVGLAAATYFATRKTDTAAKAAGAVGDDAAKLAGELETKGKEILSSIEEVGKKVGGEVETKLKEAGDFVKKLLNDTEAQAAKNVTPPAGAADTAASAASKGVASTDPAVLKALENSNAIAERNAAALEKLAEQGGKGGAAAEVEGLDTFLSKLISPAKGGSGNTLEEAKVVAKGLEGEFVKARDALKQSNQNLKAYMKAAKDKGVDLYDIQTIDGKVVNKPRTISEIAGELEAKGFDGLATNLKKSGTDRLEALKVTQDAAVARNAANDGVRAIELGSKEQVSLEKTQKHVDHILEKAGIKPGETDRLNKIKGFTEEQLKASGANENLYRGLQKQLNKLETNQAAVDRLIVPDAKMKEQTAKLIETLSKNGNDLAAREEFASIVKEAEGLKVQVDKLEKLSKRTDTQVLELEKLQGKHNKITGQIKEIAEALASGK